MSAAFEIAQLDAALAADGENIVVRRVKSTAGLATVTNVDVTCRAFVRGYRPNELVGAISQQDVHVIISPTEIDAADWPADEADSTSPIDARIPRKSRGDKAVIGGRVHSIEASKGILIDGTLVRIDMQCRGVA